MKTEVDSPENRARSMATMPSLLDDLGEEVTGIMAPVSLCMAVTVLLVRLLNPEGASSSGSVVIASIAYQEEVKMGVMQRVTFSLPCMSHTRM